MEAVLADGQREHLAVQPLRLAAREKLTRINTDVEKAEGRMKKAENSGAGDGEKEKVDANYTN
jgi:hypothetical protein